MSTTSDNMSATNQPNETRKSVCVKCGGTGNLPHFRHINDGICYACNGSGEFSHTVTREFSRKAITEIVSEHCIWQFQTLKNCFAHKYAKGETVEDVILQAVTGSGKTGKTLFRIRLSDRFAAGQGGDYAELGEAHFPKKDGGSFVATARRIYKAAVANVHPDALTDEWLGFTPGRCQIDRNRRGVDFL